MINELIKNKEVDSIVTIDSREVAEMMGRSHSDMMKMIQGSGKNLGIIPVLEKGISTFQIISLKALIK